MRCPVMIGRRPEFRALKALLAAAVAGTGGLAVITGEPGIGKTRLVGEVAGHARAQGLTVLTGRAVPTGAAEPFRPITEALLQALRHRALPGEADLAPWLPALSAIVPGLPADGTTENSTVMRGEALLRLLRRLADPALLVVLEDLQWADPDTLSILEYLGGNLAGEPVLCLVTSRSEPLPATLEHLSRLGSGHGVSRLPLARLDDTQVIEMIRTCQPEAGQDTVDKVLRAAEGVPFLVEEVLASPGVPSSFAGTVRARMAGLDDAAGLVLSAAAVFGRNFDWQLLGAVTGLADDVVAGALEQGVAAQLLTFEAGSFRFRHALTREAIAEGLLPPRQAALARDVLAAVQAAHPDLAGPWRDIAADLAVRSGDRERAGALLAASGRDSLEQGALATAADTLRRAAGLLGDGELHDRTEALLVEALTLAGRVEEAVAAGDALVARLGPADASAASRAELLLRVAQAAVAAARWPLAESRLASARDLLARHCLPRLEPRVAVLTGEVAFARDDMEAARRAAASVLASAEAEPEVRCQAQELLGRVARIHDLDSAREAFGRALDIAETAGLRIWRMRALHELGTIDMFDHAGTEHLVRARAAAADLGALSTAATVDLQLTACNIFRFAMADAARHAEAAAAMCGRLRMAYARAIALVFIGEVHALRRDDAEMERFLALAAAAAPDDPEIEGSAWAGARAVIALLRDDRDTGLTALERGVSILSASNRHAPALYRGIWPLLLACQGDQRAAGEAGKARQSGIAVNRANRGLLGYTDAVLAGRRGERQRAADAARAADAELVHYPVWADLARTWAAECAIRDGWGEPERWLRGAGDVFAAHGLDELAARSQSLAEGAGTSGASGPDRWADLGITTREADVLELVAAGLANKEIATHLYLSVRTVEKHVESMLRRTGARSRTQLVAMAGPRR